jgi:tetratricopeptide (TPR) repeat protein
MDVTPDDPELPQKIASAALRAGREERALAYLAGRGMADLSRPQIAGLHKRVLRACKNATSALDFNDALSCFHALELADDQNPALIPLRATLAHRAASAAKAAEKQGNLGEALPLAQKVLRIVPDQPSALTIMARDLWRHRRFADVVELCQARVRLGPEYASARKILDQAKVKLGLAAAQA